MSVAPTSDAVTPELTAEWNVRPPETPNGDPPCLC